MNQQSRYEKSAKFKFVKKNKMEFPRDFPVNMTSFAHRSEAPSAASVVLTSGYNPGSVTVRVTTIVAPNQFWVHEIPPSPSEFENSDLKLVLELERCLAARYSGNVAKGVIAAEHLTENLMVCACPPSPCTCTYFHLLSVSVWLTQASRGWILGGVVSVCNP